MTDGEGAGTVQALWVKRAHHGPMDPREEVELVAGRGVVGNADQGRRRQVTLIAREAWAAAEAELGRAVDPRARRANVLIGGIDLRDSRGDLLAIGSCRLRVLGETRPCPRMDEAAPGLMEALQPEWRGGAFAEVLTGGLVRVGQPVHWVGGEELQLRRPLGTGGG